MPFINFYTARPALKLLIIFLSIVTLGIIVFFIGLLLGRVIFSMHLDEVNHVLYGRYDLISDGELKYFQLIQTIGFFLVPGIFLYWIFSTSKEYYFNAKRFPGLASFALIIVAFVVGLPFMNWIIELNKNIELPSGLNGLESNLQNLEDTYAGLTERLLTANNFWQLLFNLFMVTIIPAIGEEFIFRGVFQQLFKEITRNIHISVIITAFIFSAIHGQFYGFVPRFLLGIFFGYLMVWSGTIWLPVFAHMVNNAFAVIAYYYFSKGSVTDLGVLTQYPAFSTILISILLFSFTLFSVRKMELKVNGSR